MRIILETQRYSNVKDTLLSREYKIIDSKDLIIKTHLYRIEDSGKIRLVIVVGIYDVILFELITDEIPNDNEDLKFPVTVDHLMKVMDSGYITKRLSSVLSGDRCYDVNSLCRAILNTLNTSGGGYINLNMRIGYCRED